MVISKQEPVTDADAIAYGTTVSLTGSPLQRLDRFMKAIKAAGITPALLCLYKSEFKARTSSTVYKSVIGTDGTTTSGVTDSAAGAVFDGSTGKKITYANPIKGTAITAASMWANAQADSTAAQMTICGTHDGNSSRGISLETSLKNGLNEGVYGKFPVDATTAGVEPFSTRWGYKVGIKRFAGINFSSTASGDTEYGLTDASRPAWAYKDLAASAGVSSAQTAFYNDHANFAVGARHTSTTARFTGKIDFVLVCAHILTWTQRMILINAGARFGIFDVPNRNLLVGIGDSMTEGTAGGADITEARTPQIAYVQSSSWSGCHHFNRAVSGQPIAVQEGYYADIIPVIARMTAFKRFVMFWGGYNSTAPVDPSQSVRRALVDRYIAMGLDAKRRGVQTIHWSYLMGGGLPVATAPQIAAMTDFNDYYAAQCAANGFVWYDHRITYPTQFDGATQNESYFGDGRHMNLLGTQTICADFIAKFPDPAVL